MSIVCPVSFHVLGDVPGSYLGVASLMCMNTGAGM